MLLAEYEAVVYVQKLFSALTAETESMGGLMIIILWGESRDIHSGFQCRDRVWLFKKALLEWYLFSYYII